MPFVASNDKNLSLILSALLAVLVFFSTINLSAAQVRALENQLVEHPSPYLALHGEDPVLWQDWHDDTVQRARDDDKLLFLSVGYFSCHWCHVMQRESYQNDAVAAVINEHFIPVKIDRELHPALDTRLMDFAVALHGRGGWPLNVFLTPEGHPLAAVFYRPQENFLEILQKLNTAWQENKVDLRKLAREESSLPDADASTPVVEEYNVDKVSGLVDMLSSVVTEIADPMSGGFGEGSKFPQAPILEYLLKRQQREADAQRKEFLQTTLTSMASRGLRDHIGGGFFRYTVDPEWGVPHFEKMLYGNAQLAQIYLRAGELFNDTGWTEVARDTLDFMIRDMQTESGGMVAAFSAIDANDVEGGYYLWQKEQLGSLLTAPQLQVAEIAMTLADPPPLADGHLPHRNVAIADVARQANMSEQQAEDLLAQVIEKLSAVRSERELPTDIKLLAGWNGLALSVLAEAAELLDEPRYRQAAERIRDFLMSRLWRKDELWRAEVDAKAIGAPSVEDYAYVGRGLVKWAQLTGLEKDWTTARQVLQQGWVRFYRGNGWFRTEQSLIDAEQPKPALADGSMPSPSAVMVSATLELLASEHAAKDDQAIVQQLRDRAARALKVEAAFLQANLFQYPGYVSELTDAVQSEVQ